MLNSPKMGELVNLVFLAELSPDAYPPWEIEVPQDLCLEGLLIDGSRGLKGKNLGPVETGVEKEKEGRRNSSRNS